MTLLQAITDSLTAQGPTLASDPGGLSLIELLIKGGWVMIPIVLLFLMALYFFFERLMTLNRAGKETSRFQGQLTNLIRSGDVNSARTLANNTHTPAGTMLNRGLKLLGKPIDEIERAMESAGRLEVYKLERNLPILAIVAGIAPMLGFVGTIIGVIKIFYNISLANSINLDIIAGGLYQKLITSAAGLGVGILAHLGHNYLSILVDREIYKMETTALSFIDTLQDPAA